MNWLDRHRVVAKFQSAPKTRKVNQPNPPAAVVMPILRDVVMPTHRREVMRTRPGKVVAKMATQSARAQAVVRERVAISLSQILLPVARSQ